MEGEATLGRPSRFGQCYASGLCHAIRIARCCDHTRTAPLIPDARTRLKVHGATGFGRRADASRALQQPKPGGLDSDLAPQREYSLAVTVATAQAPARLEEPTAQGRPRSAPAPHPGAGRGTTWADGPCRR